MSDVGSFYDREKERTQIPSQIRENKTESQIIVLAGTSGVGKSGLAQFLLHQCLSEIKSVTVAIGKSSNGTIDNLTFFNALYQELNSLAGYKRTYKLRTAKQHGRRNLKSWIHIILSAIKSRLHLDSNLHVAEPILEYGVSKKLDYIISLLNDGPFIVNIENIQNVDTQSNELFKHILSQVTPVTWVLEYTLPKAENQEPFLAFCNEWHSLNVPLQVYTIEKLDFDLAENLIPKTVRASCDLELLKKKYDESHGNLMTLIVAPDSITPNEDTIECSLHALDQAERYVLYLLFLNEKPMLKSTLFLLLTQIDENNIFYNQNRASELLHGLETRKFIKERNGAYCIHHDSITVAISELNVEPALYLAYRVLVTYYRGLLSTTELDIEETVIHLCSLYFKFSDERVVELLPWLQGIIMSVKYPDAIISKIECIKNSIKRAGKTNLRDTYCITRFLVELCIRLQYSEKAQENLDILFNIRQSQYLTGLQGAIYALPNVKDGENKLITLIQNNKEKERLYLSLCLCHLRIMMRSHSGRDSKMYAEQLFSEVSNQDSPEYGFLLYNLAEFSDTPRDALDLYQQAFDIFEKLGLTDIQAEIKNSMSMSLSYNGQLDAARKAIDNACALAPKRIPEYVLLNNYSTIDILEGVANKATANDLAKAVLMCTNPYEQLIIKSNWLVSLVINGCLKEAAIVAHDIESANYAEYQYEEFLHIVYQDLHFFYKAIENAPKVAFYENKLRVLANSKDTTSELRTLIIHILDEVPLQGMFYSSFRFRVDFLGFWGLEVSRDLESFQ